MKHQTVDVNMFFEKIKHFIQNEECVCVCVCVKEKERERGGARIRQRRVDLVPI